MTEAALKTIIFEGLRKVAPESDPETLRPDQRIRETLDIDSFDFLSFLVGLHEKLGITIPEADYGKLTTLEAMLIYLMAKG
jgi:acyl carrier protein